MRVLLGVLSTFWDNCWHRFEFEYLCRDRYDYLEYNVESLMKLGGRRFDK